MVWRISMDLGLARRGQQRRHCGCDNAEHADSVLLPGCRIVVSQYISNLRRWSPCLRVCNLTCEFIAR